MFEVIWAEHILDDLADILVAADVESQHRIATAVERLNARRRNHPLDEGESRSGDRRITVVDLLVVRFRILLDSDEVRVTGVQRYGQ